MFLQVYDFCHSNLKIKDTFLVPLDCYDTKYTTALAWNKLQYFVKIFQLLG